MKSTFWLLGALISQLVVRSPTNAKMVYQRFTSCLEGWYQYGDKCLRMFAKSPKDWLSWENARDACSDYGAQLASIHSKEENDFVVMYLQLNLEFAFWIGLNDRSNERKFEWDDNSAYNFTNWNTNEPSHGNQENCVEIVHSLMSGHLGKWNDQSCSYKIPYLCQMPTDSSLSNENPQFCPEGKNGVSLLDSCYTYVDSSMTWSDAESYCQATLGGHLAAITDDGVQKFLTYMLRELEVTTTLWIGLKGPGAKFEPPWSSGWFLSYTKWVNGNQKLRQGTCVSFLRSGHWEVVPCDRMFSFICEVSNAFPPKLEPSVEGAYCPDVSGDWKDFGGDYCYYINTADNMNFADANFQCLLRGGTLASIHSKGELMILEQFVRYKVGGIHVGLIKKYDNSYVWVDGSKLDFQYWDEDEPRANSNDERCIEVLGFLRSMRWKVRGCGGNRPYICSVKKKLPNITVHEDMVVCSGELFRIQ